MKVLHLNTYSRGGAAKACLRLHIGLKRLGIDSKVLTLYHTPIDIPEIYDYKKLALSSCFQKLSFRINESFRWRYQNYLLDGKAKGFDYFSTTYLYHNISRLNIFREADIVNLHWVANFLNYNELARFNKKIVWTLHDMNVFTGGCHYSSGCEQFLNKCIDCPQLDGTKNKNIVNLIFDKKLAAYSKKAAVFITPSRWLFEKAKKSCILADKKIVHIPYGVDETIFKPTPKNTARTILGLPLEKKIILFVSDFLNNKRKGFHLLMEGMAEIADSRVLLCVIGNGSGLNSERIMYLGEISEEEKMALAYSSADIFVIPSLYDNLPNTVLEAMACGTPVIGFNTGGISEMVINGENGFVTESGNIVEMRSKILKLIQDEDLLVKFAKQAKQLFNSNFTLENQASTYLQLYTGLM